LRSTSVPTSVMVALLFLGAGCSDVGNTPTSPASARGLNAAFPVQVHGVLNVPPPGSSGVQGQLTPWLTGDDGASYELVLEPGFEPLSDPASSGRGVTINGDITVQIPAPVGAEPYALRVTSFSFD
jgi:hypothetical protein